MKSIPRTKGRIQAFCGRRFRPLTVALRPYHLPAVAHLLGVSPPRDAISVFAKPFSQPMHNNTRPLFLRVGSAPGEIFVLPLPPRAPLALRRALQLGG